MLCSHFHCGSVPLFFNAQRSPCIKKESDRLKNKVEEYRKLLNEKQEDLASIVGVSRQTIISIEKGKYNPSILLAFKIANHFNKSIEEIFIYEEEE